MRHIEEDGRFLALPLTGHRTGHARWPQNAVLDQLGHRVVPTLSGTDRMAVDVLDVAGKSRVHDRIVEEARARCTVDPVMQHVPDRDGRFAGEVVPKDDTGLGQPRAEVRPPRHVVDAIIQLDGAVRLQL